MKNGKLLFLMATFLVFAIGSLNELNAQCSSDCPTLLTNGDFENGNTGFGSDLPMVASCQSGSYMVSFNARDKCTVSSWQNILDHTTGSGMYMIVDGRNNTYIWYETVNVIAGETYEFNYWVFPDISGAQGPILQFQVNGAFISQTDLENLPDSTWSEVCLSYTATVTGNVVVQLYESTPVSRTFTDYGLDDISFRPASCNVDPCEMDPAIQYTIEGCKLDLTGTAVYTHPDVIVVGVEWTFGDGYSSTDLTPHHYYTTPGVYILCLKVTTFNPETGKCCVREFCEEISIKEECNRECFVEPQFTYNIDGCTGFFEGSAFSQTPILGWLWTIDDGSSSTTVTGQNMSYVFPGPGVYKVCLTVIAKFEEGCCIETHCIEVEVLDCEPKGEKRALLPPSDKDTENKTLRVYPNPSSGELTVSYTLQKEERVNIYLYNINGELIKTFEKGSQKSGKHILQLNLPDVSSGVYLLKMLHGTQEVHQKIIIE